MRYVALFFAVVFVLFALVQLNDPDPWLWVPVYLVPAALSFLVFRGRYPVVALAVSALAFLVAGMYSFPGGMGEWLQAEQEAKSIGMGLPFIEEAREAMGLLFCFLALAMYLVAAYARRKTNFR